MATPNDDLDLDLDSLDWQISSYSGDGSGGTCFALAALPDGEVAVRNSNRPDAGIVRGTKAELLAFLEGAKAGEFDHLAD